MPYVAPHGVIAGSQWERQVQKLSQQPLRRSNAACCGVVAAAASRLLAFMNMQPTLP